MPQFCPLSSHRRENMRTVDGGGARRYFKESVSCCRLLIITPSEEEEGEKMKSAWEQISLGGCREIGNFYQLMNSPRNSASRLCDIHGYKVDSE